MFGKDEVNEQLTNACKNLQTTATVTEYDEVADKLNVEMEIEQQGKIIFKSPDKKELYVLEFTGESVYKDYFIDAGNYAKNDMQNASRETTDEALKTLSDSVRSNMREQNIRRRKLKVVKPKRTDLNIIMVGIALIALMDSISSIAKHGFYEEIVDLFGLVRIFIGVLFILIGTEFVRVSTLVKCRLIMTVVFTVLLLCLFMSVTLLILSGLLYNIFSTFMIVVAIVSVAAGVAVIDIYRRNVKSI